MSRAMHPLAPYPVPPPTAFYSPHITRGTRHHVRPVTSQQKSQRTKETHEMNETRSRARRRESIKIIRDIRFDTSPPHCNLTLLGPLLLHFRGVLVAHVRYVAPLSMQHCLRSPTEPQSQQKTWQVNSTVKTGIYQWKQAQYLREANMKERQSESNKAKREYNRGVLV